MTLTIQYDETDKEFIQRAFKYLSTIKVEELIQLLLRSKIKEWMITDISTVRKVDSFEYLGTDTTITFVAIDVD